RLIHGDLLFESAYRYQESWNTHLLDAAVRTAADFSAWHPLDFALLTGDMIDNAHFNEMEWFVEVMEGGFIDPDSGDDDDPLPGPDNDPHDPFVAGGMPPSLPWYVAPGNHDLLALGNGPLVEWMLADPTGDDANVSSLLSWLNKAVIPVCLDTPWYATESPLPERCYLPPKSWFESSDVVPDPERAFMSRHDWMTALFGTTTTPDGHGFTADDLAADWASCTIEGVVPGVPSVLVILDTVSSSGQYGTFDAVRKEWLLEQLDAAEAEAKIVIVASHHTSSSINNAGGAADLVSVLNDYPGVIAHIGGHNHQNRIRPKPAPDGLPPEHGYWEIETSSAIIWPQQSRLIEVVDNRDGTGDIHCVMLDYQIPAEVPVTEAGRFHGLYDIHSGAQEGSIGEPGDRNAVLRVAWPPEIAEALAELPHRPVQTFEFTP
ncbi:MAG TPA: metallophosphoesterase, partial [Polyangia bacterium]|nr:metallophosphoesterase [Polyangia bacterium]